MSDLLKASVNLMDTLVLERETNGQSQEYSEWGAMMIRRALLAERSRCLAVVTAIEPHNPSEAHLLETIARRVRGEE